MASFNFKDDFSPATLGVRAESTKEQYGSMPTNSKSVVFEREYELGESKYSFVCSFEGDYELQKSLFTLSCEIMRTMTKESYMPKSFIKMSDAYSLLGEIIKNEIYENAKIGTLDMRDTVSRVYICEKGFLTCFSTLYLFLCAQSKCTSIGIEDDRRGYRISIKTDANCKIPKFALAFCSDVAKASGFAIELAQDGATLEIYSYISRASVTLVDLSAFTPYEIGEVYSVIELMARLQNANVERV